jgi:uncharacterized protein (DUF2132 family)
VNTRKKVEKTYIRLSRRPAANDNNWTETAPKVRQTHFSFAFRANTPAHKALHNRAKRTTEVCHQQNFQFRATPWSLRKLETKSRGKVA